MINAIKNLEFPSKKGGLIDWKKTYTEEVNGVTVTRLGEYIQELPQNCILDKSCGLGGTTCALKTYDRVVIVMPYRKLINQKYEQFPEVFKVEEGVTKNDIVTVSPYKIITTYHSFYKLLDTIDIKSYHLVVDEFHSIIDNYDAEIHKPLLSHFKDFKSYLFMSATPPLYLPIELQKLETKHFKRLPKDINVKLVECTSPILEAINIINNIYTRIVTDPKIVTKNVFFVNSLDIIETILNNCNENEGCNALDYINIYYGESNDRQLLLENSTTFTDLKPINIITSCGFAGIDINEQVDNVYFISSPCKQHTLYRFSDIKQALGRFRVNDSLNVTHFYKKTNYKVDLEALNTKIKIAKQFDEQNLTEEQLDWVVKGLPLYKGKFDEDAVIAEKCKLITKSLYNNNNCLKLNYYIISKNVTLVKNVTSGKLKAGTKKNELIRLFGEEYVDEKGVRQIVKELKEKELLNSKLAKAEKLNLINGNYYPVKTVSLKDIKGYYNHKTVTHRINGIPTRCVLILNKTYNIN